MNNDQALNFGRAVLADKSRMGFTAEIRALLQKYGATKLSGIGPDNYKALLADAEVLTDAAQKLMQNKRTQSGIVSKR